MKYLAGLLLIVLPCLWLQAQQNVFDMGIEGGISHSKMYGSALFKERHQPIMGYSGGFTFQYNFRKHLAIRTQITYENKGTYFKDDIKAGQQTLGWLSCRFNYNYLMFPLLVRYNVGKKTRFFINAGPMLGYLLFQESIAQSNIIRIDPQYYTNSFYRLDIGFSAGIGVIAPVCKRWVLSAEIRNNTGLRSLNRYDLEDGGTVKSSSTNLLLGIAYKMGLRE